VQTIRGHLAMKFTYISHYIGSFLLTQLVTSSLKIPISLFGRFCVSLVHVLWSFHFQRKSWTISKLKRPISRLPTSQLFFFNNSWCGRLSYSLYRHQPGRHLFFYLCICRRRMVHITRVIEWHNGTRMVSHSALQSRC